MEVKRYTLFIKPQTHIRITKAERWLFAEGVTDKYLVDYGTRVFNKRVLEKKKTLGNPKAYYNRKYVIKRYFDYKRALKAEAERQGFVMPKEGAWIKFFIPMPSSWSAKKRKAMCFTPCYSKPDKDNLEKAFLDSLGEDKGISDSRVSKFYYDGVGHIEITLGELPVANGYTRTTYEEKIK